MSIKNPQLPSVDGSRGAPMGRDEYEPTAKDFPRARCFRLRFVDGCYDEGGAYWGGPADVYCATNGANDEATGLRVFVRASSRQAAKAAVAKRFPSVRWVN